MAITKKELIKFMDELVELASEENKSVSAPKDDVVQQIPLSVIL